jgi:copper(I)-binding protein
VLAAAPALASGVTVSDAWFRSLPAGLPAGGYMVLHNPGDKDAVLTAASSPACGSIMLHQSETMNGMSGMTMAESITVPAHGTFVFKPGGYHLMCMTSKMTIGTNVTVTLAFGDGTKVTAAFAVKNAKGN